MQLSENECNRFFQSVQHLLIQKEDYRFPDIIKITEDAPLGCWGDWSNTVPNRIRLNPFLTRSYLLSAIFHELVHMGRHYRFDPFRWNNKEEKWRIEEKEENEAERICRIHLPGLARTFSFYPHI